MSKFTVSASGFPEIVEVFADSHEAAAHKAYPILVKRMGWLPDKLYAHLSRSSDDDQVFFTEDFPPDILDRKEPQS